MIEKRHCRLWAVLVLGIFVMPGSSGAEGLEDALRQALEQHPSVRAAQAGFKVAEEEKDIALSAYYPDISVSTGVGRVYQDNATSRGLITERGAAYSGYGEGNIALRQTLFDGMERNHRLGAAKTRMEAKKISMADAQETLALRVVSSYIDVLRTREAMALLQEQRGTILDYEQRIATMAQDGAADETEVQQAHDVSMIMDGALAEYQGQIIAAQAAYAEVTGAMPSQEMGVPPSVQAHIPADVAEATNRAKAENPALKAAELDAVAAQEDISVAKAGYFPDIGSELSYAKVDKRDVIGGESEDARALLRMNWNFSTGGKQKSLVEQTRYSALQSRAQHEDLERRVERDVLVAYGQLQAFHDKLKVSVERVALNEKLFEAYQAQFEGARINLLGLMRAQSQLYNARLEQIDNKYNLLTAEYTALAAMGGLTQTLLGKGSPAARGEESVAGEGQHVKQGEP